RAFLQRAREEGRYVQAALTDANTWITLEPENGFACFHRASINLAVGEKDAALQDLTTGLQKADPTGTKPNRRLAQAYIHRALLLLERKQYEPAEKDLRRAQELDDEDPDLSYARSFLAERDGNAREALHLMERADFLYAQRHKTSYLLEAPMVNNRYFKRLYKLREACGFDPMKRSERFAESVEPVPAGGDDDDDDERLAQPLLPR
ncbi:MAG TPA: hypothetical protein PKO06_04060, partial [Candidatus Ozemobacteraceae bacterium]|nr:hypothetical protein [Candidatus Ozemobacteraceae bacterium]